MSRTTNAVPRHKRKKRLLKQAKGFYGDRKNHVGQTKCTVQRAMAFNYIHRKHNKRNFRRLWIIRIGVAAKLNGISYSKFINGLVKANVEINRKVLADLAVRDPEAFSVIAETAKAALVA